MALFILRVTEEGKRTLRKGRGEEREKEEREEKRIAEGKGERKGGRREEKENIALKYYTRDLIKRSRIN